MHHIILHNIGSHIIRPTQDTQRHSDWHTIALRLPEHFHKGKRYYDSENTHTYYGQWKHKVHFT